MISQGFLNCSSFMDEKMAPQTGLEPVTLRLTAACSTDWAIRAKNVGIYLFSRAASRQVSSAQMSVTSVFGMGTGGPSSQSTPTFRVPLGTIYKQFYLFITYYALFKKMVTRTRFELVLPAWEAGVLGHLTNGPLKNGAPSGTRTRDTLIKSQVLYQLS